MRFIQSIKAGLIIVISLNLLMAFGSIWIFVRMAPAIEVIIEQNERSLQACEEMLANLLLSFSEPAEMEKYEINFSDAWQRANDNITESDEAQELERIRKNSEAAFAGEAEGMKRSVAAIQVLGRINRQAMIKRNAQAQQLGKGGAWGVVFMAIFQFIAGMIIYRRVNSRLAAPLGELSAMIDKRLAGDRFRRLGTVHIPKELQRAFEVINSELDQLDMEIEINRRKES